MNALGPVQPAHAWPDVEALPGWAHDDGLLMLCMAAGPRLVSDWDITHSTGGRAFCNGQVGLQADERDLRVGDSRACCHGGRAPVGGVAACPSSAVSPWRWAAAAAGGCKGHGGRVAGRGAGRHSERRTGLTEGTFMARQDAGQGLWLAAPKGNLLV